MRSCSSREIEVEAEVEEEGYADFADFFDSGVELVCSSNPCMQSVSIRVLPSESASICEICVLFAGLGAFSVTESVGLFDLRV